MQIPIDWEQDNHSPWLVLSPGHGILFACEPTDEGEAIAALAVRALDALKAIAEDADDGLRDAERLIAIAREALEQR